MSDDLTPHQRFQRRLLAVQTGDSVEEISEKTGLELVEFEAAPGQTTQRQRFFDPSTGERVDLLMYQGSALPPTDYPPGWPFSADLDALFMTTTVEEQSHMALHWMVEEGEDELLAELDSEMRRLGWHSHDATEPTLDARVELLKWYHREGEEWRTLCRTEFAGARVIVLSDRRADLYPTTPSQRS